MVLYLDSYMKLSTVLRVQDEPVVSLAYPLDIDISHWHSDLSLSLLDFVGVGGRHGMGFLVLGIVTDS